MATIRAEAHVNRQIRGWSKIVGRRDIKQIGGRMETKKPPPPLQENEKQSSDVHERCSTNDADCQIHRFSLKFEIRRDRNSRLFHIIFFLARLIASSHVVVTLWSHQWAFRPMRSIRFTPNFRLICAVPTADAKQWPADECAEDIKFNQILWQPLIARDRRRAHKALTSCRLGGQSFNFS